MNAFLTCGRNTVHHLAHQLRIPFAGAASAAFRRGQVRRGILAICLIAAPGLAAAQLAVSKTVAVGYASTAVPVGDLSAFRITLTNNSPSHPVLSAALSDTMSDGLVVAGAGITGAQCFNGDGSAAGPWAGAMTANIGQSQITLSGGTIPVFDGNPGRCEITVEVTSSQVGVNANTIAVGGATGQLDGVPVQNDTAQTQTISFASVPAPTIGKSFSPSTIVAADQVTRLSITVRNNSSLPLSLNGIGDSPAYALEDVLPAGLKVASPPNATSSAQCGAIEFSPAAGATSIMAVGGTVSPNATCTLQVDVVTEANATGGAYSKVFTNTIDRGTQFFNRRGLVPDSNASATLTVNGPLEVSKAFSPGTVASGQDATLTITLKNHSPLNALSSVAFDDIQIDGDSNAGFGLTVQSVSNSCGGTSVAIGSNEGVRLTGGTIAAAGTCAVTVTYRGALQTAGVPQAFTNTLAQAAVSSNDANAVSNLASASVTVVDELTVSKSRNPATVAPGNPVQFTVTVNNYRAAPLTGVTIDDPLPGGMVVLSSPAAVLSSGSCSNLVANLDTPAQPTFTFDMPSGSGPNPASCAVQFWAMVPEAAAGGATFVNQIPQDGVCATGGICNHGASSTTNMLVTAAPKSVTVAKSFSPNNLPEGSVSRLTVTFSSLSAREMTAATFVDNLPAGLKVASVPNAGSTCAGAVVTATAGGTQVSMTGASIPARASGGTGAYGECTLSVDVVGSAGTYVNSLPAGALTATETLASGVSRTVESAGPINASITFRSALSGVKSFSPAVIQSGGRSRVLLRLTNGESGVLNNVGIVDTLPADMFVAEPANAYSTCNGPVVISASPGAAMASMAGATLPPNGSCDLLFDVTTTGVGPWANTIGAGQLSADGGVSNVAPFGATLTTASGNGVSVGVSHTPSSIAAPGAASRLRITLVNTGALALTNLALTDFFTQDGTAGGTATGERVMATPNATTTCPGGIVSASPNAESVALSGASLAAGQTCVVEVDVTMLSAGAIPNIIQAGAVSSDQGVTNADLAQTNLETGSQLGIVKQFTPRVVLPNEASRLRITIYNPTTQPVTALAVTDNLPTNVTVSATPNQFNTCNAAVSWPGNARIVVADGKLGAGSVSAPASCYVEIDVLSATQGDYTNTINTGELTGTAGGGTIQNSQATEDVLRVKAPLQIQKAIANLTFDAAVLGGSGFSTGVANGTPGTEYQLSIRLSNPNAAPLTALAFADNLPQGLVVGQNPAASTTCSGGIVSAAPSATSIRLNGVTLAAGTSCTVTVNVLSNIPGTYTNTIPAGTVTTYEGVSNESPTSARVVIASPPTVSKQFDPPVIPPGGVSRLTIHIDNPNSTDMTLTSALTDSLPTMPGPITVATTPNIVSTCSGTVTASAGSGSVTLGNGAVVGAGGCSIEVDVTGASAGVHNNNIPVGALQTSFGLNLDPANAPLTINTLGYVAGKVYRDGVLTDGDTFHSVTDSPIAGVALELRAGAACSGTLLASTSTDAAGNYLFANLAAGTYSVCEPVQPAGTFNGSSIAGSIVAVEGSGGTPGTASNPTSGSPSSQIVGIVLGDSGGADPKISGSVGNDFAEIVPASVAGKVFMDVGNDGIQHGVDPALVGVVLHLSGTDWLGQPFTAQTSTLPDGSYLFANVPPGTYQVTEPDQPAGTANGITTAGNVDGMAVGVASGINDLPSLISALAIAPGKASVGNDFAEIPAGRSVFGRVFLDLNDDGVPNGNDRGIGAQSIVLSGIDVNGNPVNLTTTSAADGSFAFTNVPEGNSYTLTQPNQPAGTLGGITTQGSAGGTPSDRSVAPSRIVLIDLSGGSKVSANNWFGEVSAPVVVNPDLVLAKTHTPERLVAGGNGVYTLTVSNIGAVASVGAVTVVDTLPPGLTATGVPTGPGWVCAVSGQVVSCSSSAVISAGAEAAAISVPVAVASNLGGQMIVNSALVSGGGETPEVTGNNSISDPTPIDGGKITLEGHVWRDLDHDRELDPDEPRLPGWLVELVHNGSVIDTETTDEAGHYLFVDVSPGGGYEVRFRDPDTGVLYGRAVPNEQGLPYTPGVVESDANPTGADNGAGSLAGMILPGHNVLEHSLPLDPAGVVYDAVTRQPVAGAVVTISGPAGFSEGYILGGALSQTTGVDGYYQFLLLPGAPDGEYTITVTSPAGYVPGPSSLIPACAVALQLGALPDPAVVQANSGPPALGQAEHEPANCPASSVALSGGSGSTQYYYHFTLTGESADLVNNHIPLDPLTGAIVVTKTSPLVNVAKGGLVPYTITATNTLGTALSFVDIRDLIPPGFRYREGSASVQEGGNAAFNPVEPTVMGRELRWGSYTFGAGERKSFRVVLVVGAGVGEGEYTNLAWAAASGGDRAVSNIASALVRIIPDPVFDCADIIGKVFDDKNANGYQDGGESGIPNVRVVTARGLLVTADAEGRFHVPCADIPQQDRGSNFIMKLDERTLPSGYRLTTENPRDVRTTRGKMVKLNFGATVHKVFRIEVDARAFVVDDTLSPEWREQLRKLVPQLAQQPAVARLAYRLGEADEGNLAASRLAAMGQQLKDFYQQVERTDDKDGEDERPPLMVETEITGASVRSRGAQQ